MARIKLKTRGWTVTRTAAGGSGVRRSAPAPTEFPPEFLADGVEVDATFEALPTESARRAGATTPPLDFTYEVEAGAAVVAAVRHVSGALTFHLPIESARRGAAKGGPSRFLISVQSVDPDTGRRGFVSKAIKVVLVKVGKAALDKLASALLPKLARHYEESSWKKKGLAEGWFKVTREGLESKTLMPGAPTSRERTLVFIHGTFSDTVGAFRDLASSNFFNDVAPLYGDRIYGFNHFTISRGLEENAAMLLDGLADRDFNFDVVTHSRGGLVLRTLVERASTLDAKVARLHIANAVLVASPNDGTPLATPGRWKDTIGWVANVLELFPENPFTTGAEFVANGLVWLAKHAAGDLPGLRTMDRDGDVIGALQDPPGPPPNAYSALVANYHPESTILGRMVDTGVDEFFGSANDLVVPSEGGWRVDRSSSVFIPGSRIGCFGPGGNLESNTVTHVNYFAQKETAEFLIRALKGQPHPFSAVDVAKPLPTHRVFRSGGASFASPATAKPVYDSLQPEYSRPTAIAADGNAVLTSDTFHLVILPRRDPAETQSQILAHYGAARVLEDFRLGGKKGDADSRWKDIGTHVARIQGYVDENVGVMPTEGQLKDFGELLFETLFPGAVRRLYDTARSLQRRERLNVILTSTIPWVADIPWEFAFDPIRKTSLATEELHFIRNVMTAVPAEIIDDRQRLRILVASAVPVGFGRLSIEEEVAVIRRGFEPLREAGLADVDVLPRATPAALHKWINTGKYSVVHFIGHGSYDATTERGSLIFQDENDKPYPISQRSAKEIFCGRGVRLVFLNACETGRGGHSDFNSGIAPALVAGGVPMVVANQYKVLDKSATTFAQHFYWSLAQGMELGAAAREARIAVNYSLAGESIDWAVPVVYARDPRSRLAPAEFESLQAPDSPSIRASSRKRVLQHKKRVAVWDTNSQFPELRATLDRMNGAQTEFGFEIVDLTIPLDAWYMEDRVRYLDSQRFIRRMGPQLGLLGVHMLLAIVDEPMVEGVEDQDVQEALAWWAEADEPAVMVFSTYQQELDQVGPKAARLIANISVALIEGYLCDVDSHRRGPIGCPNYWDQPDTVLMKEQRFCAPCGTVLEETAPDAVVAFNKLLRVFDNKKT